MDALTVARSEEASHAATARGLAAETLDLGPGVATFLEPGSWVNQAWNMGLDGPVSGEQLDALVRFFDRHGVEPRLPVCTLAHPTLLEGVADRGFVTDAFINVFALDLATSDAPRTPLLPTTGITVEVVDPSDDDHAVLFADVTARGFHDGETPPDVMVATTRQVISKPNSTAVLARVDGTPAGGGIIGMNAAADGDTIGAGLFGTSVLPEFRRRGVQQALMVERLRLARARGATLVTIASNPGVATERNAARFGFALSYAKAQMSRRVSQD